jgi:dissimilatory sulfite reductase (desulfoviridin) alpha/beta subunit
VACVEVCKEDAILLENGDIEPKVDYDRCLQCGQCITVCPTGTLDAAKSGYRVLLGGKLGRHPRLARELPGFYSEEQVIDIMDRCITFYKSHSAHGERFSELYEGPEDLGLEA